ncbi:MAG: hypothetical protein V3W44_10785 [Dehalococcoidales bacterium]
MGRTDIGAVTRAMSIDILNHDTLADNSAYHKLIDVAGVHVDKEVTLTAAAGATENLFQLTGTVQVHLLVGWCTEATSVVSLTNFKFELDDGGAQDDITGTVVATGAAVGTIVYKGANAAGALLLIAPTNAVVTDSGAKILYEPFFLTQKTATATYVRLSYTGHATLDVDWTFEIHYTPIQHDAALVVV